MRIHLTIPTSAIHAPPHTKTDPPLVQLAGTGELVVIELQGELNYEGDPRGKVVGLLSFERMDKPTLHLGKHHLLHGKIVSLPRPLAVIRRVGPLDIDPASESDEEEADRLSLDDERPAEPPAAAVPKPDAPSTPSRPKPSSAVPSWLQTPTRTKPTKTTTTVPETSSPPPQNRDYSSDLSSPFPAKRALPDAPDPIKEDNDKPTGKRRKVGASRGKARTKEYETVAVVRRKIVFGLRPEPIVTATVLPE